MDSMFITQPPCNERVIIAKKIADRLRTELGFVNINALRDSARRGSLLVIEDCAFINFRVRKDNQITIYEIGVVPSMQGCGYGKRLIHQVKAIAIKKQKSKIIAKCPEGLPSNTFYEHMRFVLKETQPGRKRNLNVWELTV